MRRTSVVLRREKGAWGYILIDNDKKGRIVSVQRKVILAFFSYSREDSEFALKLAKDLRQQGAAVWLDQLDIKPGELWDRAVEQGLASCQKMVLILSPNSVDSTNVMDEVSFALDEHKTVIPVLYRDCKIPFRLRRLEYVDVRTDYEGGLHKLLQVVSATAVQATIPGAQAGQIEEMDREGIEREQAQVVHIPKQKGEFESARTAKTQNSSRKLLIGGSVVVVVLGIAMLLMMLRKREQPPNPPVQEQKVQEQKAREQSASEEKRPSELNVGMAWLMQFLQAWQGPDVDALRPYFSNVVSPYFSLPSADWAAISNDKRTYFSRFPTIRYRLVRGPEIKPTPGGGVLNFDLAYDNIRSDGQRATGTTHLTITVALVAGAWKIAGIRERTVRQ
ncbi:MAG TPA: toll/interleukin-1 receptor domain-containing protein [Bryobacteraceae bacterium]